MTSSPTRAAGPGSGLPGSTPAAAAAPDFEEHLQDSVQALRATFMDLVVAVGCNPATPQEVARTLGIDKSLSWKVSKVIQEPEAEAAASHLPGVAGMRIFIKAAAAAHAPAALLDAARSAVAEFEHMVAVHTTDRATLDMLISSLRAEDDPKRLELHRKQAYHGNSVIWGVQAKTRLAAYFVAPNSEQPDLLDLAVVGGLVGYRRLRGGASWPLVRRHTYSGDGKPVQQPHVAIDPEGVIRIAASDLQGRTHGQHGSKGGASATFPLLRDFSSDPPPPIRAISLPGGVQFEIGPGPIGNAGVESCVFGDYARALFPWRADDANEYGEHPTRLFTPTEWAMCDLFIHESLPLGAPEAILHSQLAGWDDTAFTRGDQARLPLPEAVHPLGPLPNVATPLVPKYPRLLRATFAAAGWDPKKFRGYRFQMRYPPIPTVLVLRYRLAR